jgi:hypothetical protein
MKLAILCCVVFMSACSAPPATYQRCLTDTECCTLHRDC